MTRSDYRRRRGARWAAGLLVLAVTLSGCAATGSAHAVAQSEEATLPPAPLPALTEEAARLADITVARFRGDRPAAMSFTFDDGFFVATENTVRMFDLYGLRGTFFVNGGVTKDTRLESSNRTRWDRWRELDALGWEIGNHSWSHPDLTELNDEALEHQVNDARALMIEKLGKAPFSFAYPFNKADERVREVVLRHHGAARERQLFYGGDGWTREKADGWVDDAIAKGKWIVPMLHSIRRGFAAFEDPAQLDAHLRYVKSREGEIWVDTFGNVARYVKERDAATLAAHVGPREVVFRVSCPLDGKVYNCPLTVVVPAEGASSARAVRTGEAEPLPVTVTSDRILVDAVPADEPVRLTWQSGSE